MYLMARYFSYSNIPLLMIIMKLILYLFSFYHNLYDKQESYIFIIFSLCLL